MTLPAPLPIDAILPELVAALRRRPNLVLTAEPGAGKTTRVPRALLEAGLLGDGECWILEPRRLAARLAATRVAAEMGGSLGAAVGYAVRFESKVSKATRLRFVTEGLLLRRLQSDPELEGIAAVVLDEFHERHLHTDLALTLLRRLQRSSRPDLKLVAMSATLDAAPVAAFLDAPMLSSEGRGFPIELRHAPREDARPLAERVAEAVQQLHREDLGGHLLVFLPGAAEIRACARALDAPAARLGLRVLPLHGDLSAEAQQEAIAPSEQLKVILSTNVAESSVTLDGVRAVIDSGLGREARHSPWSGLSSLLTVRISQARCVQRMGRAGRTGPGLCLRLFTESDYRLRAAFDAPELQRADLAEALLGLHVLGIRDPASLHWFEAPPEASLKAAEKLLRDLGALDTEGAMTALGRRMVDLPLHPRLARLVLAGEAEGIADTARLAAALLESGELAARANLDRREGSGAALSCDLLPRLDAYREAEAAAFHAGALRAAKLDPGAVHRARLARRSLGQASDTAADSETALQRALLMAYPDRVASRGEGRSYRLCEGGGATLDPASRVKAALLLALDADARGASVSVRLASALEPEWLLEAFPERLREEDAFEYNEARRRVERVSGLWFGEACLDATRQAADPSDPRAAALLAQAAQGRNLGETFDRLVQRATFLRKHRPDLELPEDLDGALLVQACTGLASLKELEAVDWAWTFRARFGEAASQLLAAWAPETVQLPKGRPARIQYEGESPWVAARLQDFWGLKKGPALAGGAVPLVLHLLAPNMRALQVTTDLAGFWERVYKELRPALSRRYPKHHWPE
ncbi:MAG TPA: ATP-dependent helicase HrpB [Holophagaceae bacterium]|nr:ATP-dependent helicase HrpB [Holophagaceae bacterium]